MAAAHIGREQLCPLAQRLFASLADERPSLAVDDLGCAIGLAGGDVVANRIAGLTMRCEPVRGQLVSLPRVIARLQSEPFGEEVMVTEPLAAVIERDDEQVQSVEVLDQRLGVVDARDGLAQGCVEAIEDRGGQQETAQRCGQLAKDLVAQVIGDVTVIAGELIDEGRWVSLVPQRQGEELNAGGPSFDSFGQHAHVGLVEPDPQFTVE